MDALIEYLDSLERPGALSREEQREALEQKIAELEELAPADEPLESIMDEIEGPSIEMLGGRGEGTSMEKELQAAAEAKARAEFKEAYMELIDLFYQSGGFNATEEQMQVLEEKLAELKRLAEAAGAGDAGGKPQSGKEPKEAPAPAPAPAPADEPLENIMDEIEDGKETERKQPRLEQEKKRLEEEKKQWEEDKKQMEERIERLQDQLEQLPHEEYHDPPEHQRAPMSQGGEDVAERERAWRAERERSLKWLLEWAERDYQKHLENRPTEQQDSGPAGENPDCPPPAVGPGALRIVDPVSGSAMLGGPSGRAGAASPVEIVITSTGGSTGPVMEMYAVNHGGSLRIRGEGIVLEPVELDPRDLRRVEQIKAAAAGAPLPARAASVGPGGAPAQEWEASSVVKVTLDVYCLQFARAVPAAGQVFRIAGASVQAANAPMRSILAASRRLRDQGQLDPDSDPTGYFHSIRQWAIWAQEEGLDAHGFEKAFLEHTRKNLEGTGGEWNTDIEETVRSLIPNRWQDITQILDQVRIADHPQPSTDAEEK